MHVTTHTHVHTHTFIHATTHTQPHIHTLAYTHLATLTHIHTCAQKPWYLADVDVVRHMQAHVEVGQDVEDGDAELAMLDQGHAHLECVGQHGWYIILSTHTHKVQH